MECDLNKGGLVVTRIAHHAGETIILGLTLLLATCALSGCGSNTTGGGGFGGFAMPDAAPCGDTAIDATKPSDVGDAAASLDIGSDAAEDVSGADAVGADGADLDAGLSDTNGGGSDAGNTTDSAASGDIFMSDSAADGLTADTVNKTPTFKQVYDDVLLKFGCTASLCHGAKSGDLAYFTDPKLAYDLVVNKASKVKACQFLPIVLPGKPETSVLYTKVKIGSKTCGGKMPIGSEGLPDTATKLIYDWILAGAPK